MATTNTDVLPGGRASSSQQVVEKKTQVFLSDEAVGTSFVYQFFKMFYRFARFVNGFEIKGLENLPPPGKGALLIGMHSTHNFDIICAITGLYEMTGRAPRGLMHRVVIATLPIMKKLGLVAGHRDTAKQLLQSGYMTAVLPGGAEEAMCGHEKAYELHPRWNDRRGFAQVAIDAGVDIIPIFLQNFEEMRFNPIFYLCNKIGFTRGFQRLVDWLRPRSASASKSLWQVGFFVWWFFSYASVPVPVKVTMFVGKPLAVKDGDLADDVAIRARAALQAMISQHQPHGRNIISGIRERFSALKED